MPNGRLLQVPMLWTVFDAAQKAAHIRMDAEAPF